MAAITTLTPKLIAAFGKNWDDFPTQADFTDISDYLMSWSWSDGARREFDTVRAGTARFVLRNDDRRFEPDYSSGAHYPDIQIGLPIGFCLEVDDDVINGRPRRIADFMGYAEAWTVQYPGKDAHAVTVLEVADPLALLSRIMMSGSLFTAQGASYHIGSHCLNDAGYYKAGWIDVDYDTTWLQIHTPSDETSCLSTLELIARSAAGRISCHGHFYNVGAALGAYGTVTYHNRHYTSTLGAGDGQTFGDSGTEIKYTGIDLASDRYGIVNECRVTRVGGTEQTAANVTSQSKFGEETLLLPGLLMSTDNVAMDRARHEVQESRSTPDLTCRSVTTTVQLGDDFTNHVVALDTAAAIGYPNIVRRRPAGGDLTGRKVTTIGRYWKQPKPKAPVECTLYFEPRGASGMMWILGDATYGVLGETTQLGW